MSGKLLELKSRSKANVNLKNLTQTEPVATPSADYSKICALDGDHPWMKAVPDGFISYEVRILRRGKVAYFNYALAKEMGLIGKDHPHQLNPELEAALIETFSLRIINEYDLENKIRYPKKDIKPKPYMATRYLQLQHASKSGKTSGDGRCIWNGLVQHRGAVWDVSSRGTGVTQLAPGAVDAQRSLKSGNTDFGYGCGTADIDELYGAAIMAEIFHNHGMNTERVLAIIDIGQNLGVGVRAAKNLFRPAHLFLHLKQNNLPALKKATDFILERQVQNGDWKIDLKKEGRYKGMLQEVCDDFAHLSAILEREYIFAWMDWDGDNILTSAGIIDYGSIRQFGVRHDQYRYDDEDRFSTNLNEQKAKAKMIVQVFAQIANYLETGAKTPLAEFGQHPILKEFERRHELYLHEHFLYQLGLTEAQSESALGKNWPMVKALYQIYSQIEKIKTQRRMERVGDGLNRPAIFNLRTLARELPRILLERNLRPLEREDVRGLFEQMLTDSASQKDKKFRSSMGRKIDELQSLYLRLVTTVCGKDSLKRTLQRVESRSRIINRADRITGNAMIHVVEEILKARRLGLNHSDIQKVIDGFIASQLRVPEVYGKIEDLTDSGPKKCQKLLDSMLALVFDYSEDI